jgi:hypothetical protein
VSTTPSGRSTLEIDARLTADKDFSMTSMYGVGWGIEYGEEKISSETYLAMWSYYPESEAFGWHTMNSRVNMSQNEIKANTR